MTTATIMPLAARMDRELQSIENGLARIREVRHMLGDGAVAYGGVTVYVRSKADVDAAAAGWGTRAAWDFTRIARYIARPADGAVEVIWVPADAEAAA